MSYEDLEGRTLVLETKVDYLQDSVSSQAEQFRCMCDGMTEVREHIAKQNGALPRIEQYAREAKERLGEVEVIFQKHSKEEQKADIENAIAHTTMKLKQKAFWVVIGAITSAAFSIVISYLLP